MTCTTCGTAMLSCRPKGWFCPRCWAVVEPTGDAPKASEKRPREQHEACLVRDIVRALELRGRTVLRVGQYRADKSGQTAGCPDLFVWSPPVTRGAYCQVGQDFARSGGWIGIEVKVGSGRLSPAQRAFVEAGQVQVARSIEEAFEICEETL